MRLTAGTAQGSILGPDLWNITYNDILRLQIPNDCQVIGYADNITIAISAKKKQKTSKGRLPALPWLESHELEPASHKTDMLLKTRKQKLQEVLINNDDLTFNTKEVVIYLGVRLDSQLTYWAQIQHAKTTAPLGRLIANMRVRNGSAEESPWWQYNERQCSA